MPRPGSREDQSPAAEPARPGSARDEQTTDQHTTGQHTTGQHTTGEHVTGVPEDAVARRTPTGWKVGDEEVPDLTSAMVLADLLAAELPGEEQWQIPGSAPSVPDATPGQAAAPGRGPETGRSAGPAAGTPGPRPRTAGGPGAASAGAGKQATGKRRIGQPRPGQHGSGEQGSGQHGPGTPGAEIPVTDAELKETVAQLERALTVRVRVEQAIGVLAERHRLRPRQAFELLRSASRARGARVSQTAGEVVASATNPLLRIPEELARQPEGPRGRPPRRTRRNP